MRFETQTISRFGDADEIAVLSGDIGKIKFDPGGLRNHTEATLVWAPEFGSRKSPIALDVLARQMGVYDAFYPVLSKDHREASVFRGPKSLFTVLQHVIFVSVKCDRILRCDRTAIQEAIDLVLAYNARMTRKTDHRSGAD